MDFVLRLGARLLKSSFFPLTPPKATSLVLDFDVGHSDGNVLLNPHSRPSDPYRGVQGHLGNHLGASNSQHIRPERGSVDEGSDVWQR